VLFRSKVFKLNHNRTHYATTALSFPKNTPPVNFAESGLIDLVQKIKFKFNF